MKKSEPLRFPLLTIKLLLFFTLFQVQVYAQSPLEKRISINLKNELLKSALDKISAASNVKFTYNEQIAKSQLKISVSAKDENLNEVLTKAFAGQPLKFTRLGAEIYVKYNAEEKNTVNQTGAKPAEGNSKYTLGGTISSARTGETIIAATVRVVNGKPATSSNEYGFYSLTLPNGNVVLEVSAIGFKPYTKSVTLNKNLSMNILLEENANELETVTITSSANNRSIDNPQMGMERLTIAETKTIPVILGERDVIKTLQLLPGVKSSSEGTGGFFVRGGSSDQNMILLDEAPVYNANHLLGFFSTFNSDAIKNVTLYKSGMPAQYGGRLSSVMDIKMNDGNNQKLGVSGGVGMIAARINVEGPIQQGKSSFLISARRTYLDPFIKLSSDSNVKDVKLYFYDVNAKANYILGDKDRLFISGYLGRDVLGSDKLIGLDWGNITSTLRWNHIFNSKLFSNTSLIFSNYDYTVKNKEEQNSLSLYSQIRDWNFKQDFQWFANEKNTVNFGLNAIYHTIKPGEVRAEGNNGFISQDLQSRYSLENAAYISNTWKASDVFSLTYGLRLSAFSILGSGDYYDLNSKGEVIKTTSYKRGEIVKTYFNLEPRIAASLKMSEVASFKASYVRNTQNLHLISNSGASSPIDRWIASSNIIKPETSDQVSLGYYRNLADNAYEFTSEVYYKNLKNQVDYRDGANVFTPNPIETQLLYGKGRAYGIELLLKKKTGNLTGWIGYTLSKSERQIDGINNNNWYNTTQDKTHDISIVGMYALNEKWSLSANWVFSTGNAATFPTGKYQVLGHSYFYYTERNGQRMPAYHRLDIGATRKLKQTKKFSSELSMSLYNAYGRSNPYSIEFRDNAYDPNRTEAVKTSLFRFIPSISYDFKF